MYLSSPVTSPAGESEALRITDRAVVIVMTMIKIKSKGNARYGRREQRVEVCRHTHEERQSAVTGNGNWIDGSQAVVPSASREVKRFWERKSTENI